MMFSLGGFHEEIGWASNRFGLSFEALHSLFRNAHVTHMKRSSHSIRSQTMRHVKSYLNGTSILHLATKCNYPPSMMARLIVENVAASPSSSSSSSVGGAVMNNNNNNTTKNVKKFVTEALRHPEKTLGNACASLLPEYAFSEKNGCAIIRRGERLVDNFSGKPLYDDDSANAENGSSDAEMPLSRLCLEVREAIDSDPMYGPRQDRERHNVGIEYELLLEQTLRSMDIPFETEAELRERGTAKTPDILLSCPVGIKVRRRRSLNRSLFNQGGAAAFPRAESRSAFSLEDDDEHEWKIVCWIDSKALFGDIETHTNNVLPQVEAYVHRFGPGLVLYWFGHAPLSRLGDGHGDVVIVGGDVPDVMMLPTGEVHGRGGRIEDGS